MKRTASARSDPRERHRSAALWAQLPPGAADAFLPHVLPMAHQVLHEIQSAVPAYSARHDEVASIILSGVTCVAERCLGEMGPDRSPQDTERWHAWFRELGRTTYRSGGSLESLQSAYRVAARSGWHYISAFLQDVGMSSDQICVCAEAIFATIDEISAVSAAGYDSLRDDSVLERRRQRGRLLDALLADGGPDAARIAALALSSGWTVPERVVAVALEAVPDTAETATVLDDAVLRRLDGPRPCLVTADPQLRLARLEARLRGRRAAIGPEVPLAFVGESLRCARRALELVEGGVLPVAPVLDCSDHLVTMWVVDQPFLTLRLAEAVFAPFGPLSGQQRDRLGQTLLEWLRHNGNSVDVARSLQLHPQTVRYRLHQLRSMFGDQLDDPETRFTMELVLRAFEKAGDVAS